MKLDECRILISLPCYGGLIYDRCEASLSRLQRWCSEKGIHMSKQTISNESLLPRARNMGVAKLLDHADWFTHILFLDADMGFNPYRLGRLLEFDQDFVGCPGPTKHIHYEYLPAAILDGKPLESASLRYAVNFLPGSRQKLTDGFMEVKDFGCCFCLVKTSAIQKMVEAYPETKAPHMAWINGKPSESENNYALFDTFVDAEEERYLECDHAFMGRWRKLGGKIYADVTSDLMHIGMHHYQGNMAQQFFGRNHISQGLDLQQTPIGERWDRNGAEIEQRDFRPLLEDDAKFHVTIIRPEGNRYPLCFYEASKLMQHSIRDAGYDCTRRENRIEEDRVNIVFGWHMIEKPLEVLRQNPVIIYQAEQMAPGGRPMPDWYAKSLKEALAVWDYSEENLEILQMLGYSAQLVPPLHHPKMELIEYDHDAEKETDVLFIGAMNERREFMMRLLGNLVSAKAICDVWGPERDEMIATAKLVVNIHYYQAQTMELLRLSHLVSSGVPVVSEAADSNPYGDGIACAQYSHLPRTVLNYLANDQERKELGLRGQANFRETDMVEKVDEAIETLRKNVLGTSEEESQDTADAANA